MTTCVGASSAIIRACKNAVAVKCLEKLVKELAHIEDLVRRFVKHLRTHEVA